MLTLLLASLLACTTTTVTSVPECEIEVLGLSTTEGAPGDTLVLTARPLTTDFDSALYFDSVQGELSAVDRTDCDTCDSCRELNGCTACSACSACDLTCEQTCVETVTAVVPQLGAGTVGMRLYNAYGTSPLLDFTVLESDTGSPADDTGGAGGSDSGSAGGTDSGSAAPPSSQP